MNIKVSFLICAREVNKEPVIAIKKNKDNYELPTFDFYKDDSNIDIFVKDKFKEFSSYDANFKDIEGWVNLFICGTIVDLNSSSIVYACYLQEPFEKEDIEWKTISSVLENKIFENKYTQEVIYCFNSFSR
ncbi:hypothetical protein EBU24_00235 [bacterium]|nr:hypothetical protein [bacterium]